LSNIKEDSIGLPDRAGFIYRYRKIITVAIVASYISAFSLSILKDPFALLVVHFPLFIGLIYSIKILNVRLKDITGIKNIVVALSWAVLGTSFPLAVAFKNFNQIVYIFYFIFIKFFINTTLFDVRDIKGDRINGVITIPVYLGLQKTKYLLLILNSTFIMWLFFSYLQGFFQEYFFVLTFTIFYGYFYILHFCGEGIEIRKSLDLLVDGEWILVVIVASIFA
jgi:4-hydroxybenzoate polyprenyltransferase